MDDYIYNEFAEEYEIITGTMMWKYTVYSDGVVRDQNGDIICTTGGVECLLVYVDENVPEHHQHIDGLYYYIYKNGTVLDADFNPICMEGGLDCLI